jgi:hypothetical protein
MLFGSALTGQELQQSIAGLGDEGMQLGAILPRLKASLIAEKGRLESIGRGANEHVFKRYAGYTLAQLNRAIAGIDTTLADLEGRTVVNDVTNDNAGPQPAPRATAPAQPKSNVSDLKNRFLTGSRQ